MVKKLKNGRRFLKKLVTFLILCKLFLFLSHFRTDFLVTGNTSEGSEKYFDLSDYLSHLRSASLFTSLVTGNVFLNYFIVANGKTGYL